MFQVASFNAIRCAVVLQAREACRRRCARHRARHPPRRGRRLASRAEASEASSSDTRRPGRARLPAQPWRAARAPEVRARPWWRRGAAPISGSRLRRASPVQRASLKPLATSLSPSCSTGACCSPVSFFNCSAPLTSSTLTVVNGTPRRLRRLSAVSHTAPQANVYSVTGKRSDACVGGERDGVVLDEIGRQALRLDVLRIRRRRAVGIDDLAVLVDVAVHLLLAPRRRPRPRPRRRRTRSAIRLELDLRAMASPSQSLGRCSRPEFVIPLCRRSASSWGARPRNATNDSIASRVPPRASTSSRNRSPATGHCTPSSSKTLNASAESTAAHL